MDNALKGFKVAILVTDGFEQVELVKPRIALDLVDAESPIVSPMPDRVRGWNHRAWGEERRRRAARAREAGRLRRAVAAGGAS